MPDLVLAPLDGEWQFSMWCSLMCVYVKLNEFYVVGPEGWQDKFIQNEEVTATTEPASGET